MFSHETIQRFKDIEAELTLVVEEHLPGDFGSWETENSTWDGEVKTVHNAGESPSTRACVWRIFLATEMSDDFLGFTDWQTNSQALNELGIRLKQAVEAIERLSRPIQIKLDHTASERLRESYDQPPEQFGSASVTLLLVEQAMRSGIEAALSRLSEIGDEKNRKKSQGCSRCRSMPVCL